MRVYLDKNVLVSVEDSTYSLTDFLSITGAEYYYSNAHICELLNGVDKSIPGLKDKRLSTINAICGNQYLFQDSEFVIRFAKCKPEQAYENIRFVNSSQIINAQAKSFAPNRAGIQKELQLYAKEVGNYLPCEIFKAIDKQLRKSKCNYSIAKYLLECEAYTESVKYLTLFNLLDTLGYRKDKDNVARLYDSYHAYFANKCDVLVSDDKKMRVKAEAVYHYFNVNTKVISAKEFLAKN